MILKEFSKYLQENKERNSVILLNEWLTERLNKPSLNKADKVIQTELYFAKNNNDKTLIIAKSETGRTLINALYNFALSFEQYKFAKFLHEQKPENFNKDKKQ